MTRRFVEISFLTAFGVMALLLYRSTLAFPEMTQNSTAAYIRFLAVALGGLSLLELFLGNWARRKVRGTPRERLDITKAPGKFWGLLGLMVTYGLLLEPFGFYLASAFFLPISMYLLGARKIVSVAATSGGVLLFVYLVFARLLEVPLPEATLF